MTRVGGGGAQGIEMCLGESTFVCILTLCLFVCLFLHVRLVYNFNEFPRKLSPGSKYYEIDFKFSFYQPFHD